MEHRYTVTNQIDYMQTRDAHISCNLTLVLKINHLPSNYNLYDSVYKTVTNGSEV